MLGYFIFDMARDPDLQAKFVSNPEGTMKDAGLSEEERHLLRSGDVASVAQLVAKEVHTMATDPIQPIQPKWIGPRLRVTSLSPTHGTAGHRVVTKVHGTFFSADATCALKRDQHGHAQSVVGQVSDVVTGDTSSMNVAFTLDKNLTAGEYDVEVTGTVSTRAQSDVLRNAFRVSRGS